MTNKSPESSFAVHVAFPLTQQLVNALDPLVTRTQSSSFPGGVQRISCIPLGSDFLYRRSLWVKVSNSPRLKFARHALSACSRNCGRTDSPLCELARNEGSESVIAVSARHWPHKTDDSRKWLQILQHCVTVVAFMFRLLDGRPLVPNLGLAELVECLAVTGLGC